MMASPAQDEMVRSLSADGSVAVRALVATELVSDAASRHTLAPTAANALGRALMGGVLIAAGATDGETVQIQFKGDGPLGSMLVIADHEGRVRGTVANPAASPPLRDGRFDVGAAVGRGVLIVVRSNPRWREPHTGIVPLETGEVARDLAHYLRDSEQTPSAVGLGVSTGRRGEIDAAGGFLVQALPAAGDETLAQIEANVRSIGSTAELVRAGAGGSEILDALLDGVGTRSVHRSRPSFYCPCRRERVQQTVVLLGREELRELVVQRESLTVRCEFCGASYVLDADELGALMPDA